MRVRHLERIFAQPEMGGAGALHARCAVQPGKHRRIQLPRGRRAGAHEQALVEEGDAFVIADLRGADDRGIVGRPAGQDPGQAVADHRRSCVVQEAQAVAGGRGDDVAQRLRRIALAQLVVEQGAEILAQHRAGDIAHRLQHRAIAVVRARKGEQAVVRRAHPRDRVGDAFDMMQQHVANRPAQMPAGQRVVADEGDAPVRQHPPDQPHRRRAHRIGHPGIKAVGDHIIIGARHRLGAVEQVAMLDADIGQPSRVGQPHAARHRLARQVEAVELCLGIGSRERDLADPVAAGDFQHARAGDVGRVEPVKDGDRREMVGVRRRKQGRGIGDIVIGGRAAHSRRPLRAIAEPISWPWRTRPGG